MNAEIKEAIKGITEQYGIDDKHQVNDWIQTLLDLAQLFLQVSENGVKKKYKIRMNVDTNIGCEYCERAVEYCNCYKVYNQAIDASNALLALRIAGIEEELPNMLDDSKIEIDKQSGYYYIDSDKLFQAIKTKLLEW